MNENSNTSTRKHSHHNSFLTTSGISSKKTNRHLSALDFLLNIPMENEIKIREHGMKRELRARNEETNNVGDSNDLFQQYAEETTGGTYDFAGRKLQGMFAPVARIPDDFRYSVQRLSEQSGKLTRWIL
jgi:hypothetical protein